MSDPLVWNGSTWVRPAFWDGSAWLSYIPPTYDVPHGKWDFTADAEGWAWTPGLAPAENPANWESGYVYGRTPDGLFDYGTMAGPLVSSPVDPSALSIGVKTRLRVLMDSGSTSGLGKGLTINPFGSAYAKYITGLQHGIWTIVDTPQLGSASDFVYGSESIGLRVGIEDPDLGYNDGHFRVEVDYAYMWDKTNNRQLMALGDPGWEPRVWTGTEWL